MVGLGKPVNPNDWVLIRSRCGVAVRSAWTDCAPRATAACAWATSRVARASAKVGLPASATSMAALSSDEPSACHQGPAMRASGRRLTPAAEGSPAIA